MKIDSFFVLSAICVKYVRRLTTLSKKSHHGYQEADINYASNDASAAIKDENKRFVMEHVKGQLTINSINFSLLSLKLFNIILKALRA